MKTYWKLFLILLVASIFGFVTSSLFVLDLQGGASQYFHYPLYILLIVQLIGNTIVFAVVIPIGLSLAKKVGLKLPILEGWLEGREIKGYLKSILRISIGLGVLAAILMSVVNYIFSPTEFTFGLANTSQFTSIVWHGFLASFYNGINEEILLRLFLMTLLVWIFFKIKKTSEGKPTRIGVWLAILLAPIIVVFVDISIAATVIPITSSSVAHTIILNLIGGVIFGWLYWKKGLESAMLSNFCSSLIIRVVLPSLFISTAI